MFFFMFCFFSRSAHGLVRTARTFFVSTMVLFFGYLHAQNDVPAPDSTSLNLQQVVIQATRASASAPVPHTNVRSADIRRAYHAQDLPYLLSATPSTVENSDAGTGIGYTGMRIRGTDPTRINVTLNGVPLNDAESQAVFWVNLPDLAASATEIQVQRGVGNSTNGAGAFGATVNIDLSEVKADPFAEISSTLGSFNTQKFSARAGTGLLDRRWAFSGRLSSIRSDGYIDRATADLNAYHLSGAYVGDKQSFQAHVLSGREVTYQAWYGVPTQYADDPARRMYNVAGTEKPGTPYDNEVDNYRQTHYLLHYKRLLTNHLQLQLNGHYTRGKGFFEQYKADQAFADYGVPAAATADTTDLIRRLWLDNHFYGTTFALQWKPENKAHWLLGGAWSRYQGGHYGDVIWAEFAETLPKETRYYENNADKRDANLYAKTDIHFNHGWNMFVDLQYRNVQYTFLGFDNNLNNVDQAATLHFFNPKMGLSRQLNEHAQAYFFAGVANREPNRDDFTQSTPDTRPKPERLHNIETGLRWNNATWNATANLYYMHYRDQLVLDGRLNAVGAYIRTNVPKSYRAGVELEGTVQATARLRVAANLSLSQNRIRQFIEYRDNWDTGQQDVLTWRHTPIAYSPAVVSRIETGYAFWKQKQHRLELSLAGKYVGKQYLDNTGNDHTTLSDYAYADARLHYDWTPEGSRQRASLLLSVNNLFDAQYSNNGWTYRYTSEGYDETPFNPYARAEGNGSYNQTGFFTQAGRYWMLTLIWGIGL